MDDNLNITVSAGDLGVDRLRPDQPVYRADTPQESPLVQELRAEVKRMKLQVSLANTYEDLNFATIQALRNELKHFIERVEEGSIRSKKTYQRFKDVLAKHFFNGTPAKRIAALETQLKKCAELLNDVRTGEDFECTCHEAAEEAEKLLAAGPP